MKPMLKPVAVLALLISVMAAQVNAQGFTRNLARTGLTQEDVNIMVSEGAQLYQGGNATVGIDTVWNNPETGAHGLAEIVEVDGSCIRIAYRFKTERNRALQTFEIRRCVQNGEWVLSG